LLIAIDDLNDWVGCLKGHPQTLTPNIDRLAKRGTLFTNAHCQAPLCNPSRTSILYGLRPSTSGIYDNAVPPWRVADLQSRVTLPRHFAANGYKTLTTGKIYHDSGMPPNDFQSIGPVPGQRNKYDARIIPETPQGARGLWDFGPQTYGDERFALPIAKAIIARRELAQPLVTTLDLANLVAGVVKKREPGQDPATRTFQALRIFINKELDDLVHGLQAALDLLKPGGRLVVISFHSLEDRIVKQFMQMHSAVEVPRGLPIRAKDLPQGELELIARVKPSSAEVCENPRARSAVMRVAQKRSLEAGLIYRRQVSQ
jgi:hypothetical protein